MSLIAIKDRIGTSDTVTGSSAKRSINIPVVGVVEGATSAGYLLGNNEEYDNLLIGMSVTISGFTNSENNGTFLIKDKTVLPEGDVLILENSEATTEEADARLIKELRNHGLHVVPLISITSGGNSSRVSIIDTATKVPANNFVGRKQFLIYNMGDNDADIGWDNNITYGSHFNLPSKSTITLALSSELSLYAICNTDLDTVFSILEVG
jgi:hypothetical protein